MASNQIAFPLPPSTTPPPPPLLPLLFSIRHRLSISFRVHFSPRQRNVPLTSPPGSLQFRASAVINSLDRSEQVANAVRGESISPPQSPPPPPPKNTHKTNPTTMSASLVCLLSSHCTAHYQIRSTRMDGRTHGPAARRASPARRPHGRRRTS